AQQDLKEGILSRTVTGKSIPQRHVTVRTLCPIRVWEEPSVSSPENMQEQTCVTKNTRQPGNRHIMKTLEAGRKRENPMEPYRRQGKPDRNRRASIGRKVLETSHAQTLVSHRETIAIGRLSMTPFLHAYP